MRNLLLNAWLWCVVLGIVALVIIVKEWLL